jgi:hypothetical protein
MSSVTPADSETVSGATVQTTLKGGNSYRDYYLVALDRNRKRREQNAIA